MILYDEEDTVSLEAYGIRIPVHKIKAARILEVLRSHPVPGEDPPGSLSSQMIRYLGHGNGVHLVAVGPMKGAIDVQDLLLPLVQP